MKEEYEMACFRQDLRGYAKGLLTVGDILQEEDASQYTVKESLEEIASHMTQMSYESFDGVSLEGRKLRYIRQVLKGQGICLVEGFVRKDRTGGDIYVLLLYGKGAKPYESSRVAEILSLLFECEFEVSPDDLPYITNESRFYHFVSSSRFMVMTGYARAKKEGEEISGDHFSMEEWPNRFYSVMLSDGTGSGEHASAQSDSLLGEMEMLLDTHFTPESAIRLVNAIWSVKGEENGNPTLDLAEIDLHSGSTSLYKLGAPSSFLKRGGEVEEFGDISFPVGLFGTSKPVAFSFQLIPGEVLFLMTDGITNSFLCPRAKLKINEVIKNIGEAPLQEMASILLQAAILQAGGEIRDDMTVVAMRLEERAIP